MTDMYVRPRFIMMIGIPGSGKSTIIKAMNSDNNLAVISSDNYIEKKAMEEGKTYSDVFSKYIESAETNMYNQVRQAVRNLQDIVWDQTNLTVKTRAKKLKEIPSSYHKIAYVVTTPDKEELMRRLASRPGKNIPEKVLNQMIESYQEPSFEEGFDWIRNEKGEHVERYTGTNVYR